MLLRFLYIFQVCPLMNFLYFYSSKYLHLHLNKQLQVLRHDFFVKVLKLVIFENICCINILKSKIPLFTDSTMEYAIGETRIIAKTIHRTPIIIKLTLLSFNVFLTFMFIDLYHLFISFLSIHFCLFNFSVSFSSLLSLFRNNLICSWIFHSFSSI